jgi:hypothetical protein
MSRITSALRSGGGAVYVAVIAKTQEETPEPRGRFTAHRR